MSTNSNLTEYAIRSMKREPGKRYSILKFNESLRVETGDWTDPGVSIRMSRDEGTLRVGSSIAEQEYGEGTEYGKAAREEAKRKKYGRKAANCDIDNQLWNLTINDANGKEKKFRSIREGTAGEHADYWLFSKVGNEFHAVKVDEWYQFLPISTHRTLDFDEAEEQFRMRNRIMNQFALKAQIQRNSNNDDEDGETVLRATKSLIIKDGDTSSEESHGNNKDDDDNSNESTTKKVKSKKAAVKRDKRQRVQNGDEVAAYESDDGDEEGREVDYITDSGSDSDRDLLTAEAKVDEAMVGVGDETGLRKLIGLDELSDSSNSGDETEEEKKSIDDAKEGAPKKRTQDIEERDSSGSDSDDPDKGINSALFLPAKPLNEKSSSSAASAKKRTIDDSSECPISKKMKATETSTSGTSNAQSTESEEPTEETVRKYLRRKPHSTKELLAKFKCRCGDLEKTEIVSKLAMILKKMNPYQKWIFQNKKKILYFAMDESDLERL